MASTALAIALCCLLAVSAQAQDSGPQTHYLTNMPAPGEVTVGVLFPTYPNKKFPAGKYIDAVVGIHNDGSETYNISMIAGSLNSPADFSVHIQNFSTMGYSQVIKPGEELSLEYKFYPDARLEPRDFIVALTAFYSDSKGQWHSSTFFNGTVNIIEIKGIVDWELLFLILMFSGILSAAGYGVYSYVVAQGWVKNSKQRARSSRPRSDRSATAGSAQMSEEDAQDWVKGTPYDAFVRSKSQRQASMTKRTNSAAAAAAAAPATGRK